MRSYYGAISKKGDIIFQTRKKKYQNCSTTPKRVMAALVSDGNDNLLKIIFVSTLLSEVWFAQCLLGDKIAID
jgi:hypothetical protein